MFRGRTGNIRKDLEVRFRDEKIIPPSTLPGKMRPRTRNGRIKDCRLRRSSNSPPGADSIGNTLPGAMSSNPKTPGRRISGRESFRARIPTKTAIFPHRRPKLFLQMASDSMIWVETSGNGARTGTGPITMRRWPAGDPREIRRAPTIASIRMSRASQNECKKAAHFFAAISTVRAIMSEAAAKEPSIVEAQTLGFGAFDRRLELKQIRGCDKYL